MWKLKNDELSQLLLDEISRCFSLTCQLRFIAPAPEMFSFEESFSNSFQSPQSGEPLRTFPGNERL
jgi:hypothetical protein